MLSDPKGTPLMFVVRQKKAVLSFQVPLTLRGLYQRNYQYKDVARTLCQPPKRAENETQYIYVDVSTLSEKNATYRLSVTHLQNFVLLTEERFSFNATPSQPQYFKYMFKEGLDSVIVQVSSPMAFPCSVISIQDIQCPVYDLDNNVAFIGMYQTMTKKAAITVQRKDYPSGGFYVVVVVKTEDEACGGGLPYYPINPDVYMDHGTREKAIEVLVKPAISRYTYLGGILFVFGVFLAFYFLRKPMGHPPRCASCLHFPGKSPGQKYNGCGYGSLGKCPSTELLLHPRPSDGLVSRPRLESLSSVEEDDYDTLTDIESDKNVIRTKKYLSVADLARKDKRVIRKKYQIYFWNISTIAVFYALPVVQLVITYQTVVNVTGNQDICYYNFLCAHPLGSLSAFNNILSNLGYVMLGLLFLIIVLQRELSHNRVRPNALTYFFTECTKTVIRCAFSCVRFPLALLGRTFVRPYFVYGPSLPVICCYCGRD
uniref:SID1 transmembrane family member 2 n=1 Tax=Leptobrachium leishanense TaxID=445787 RepID=A0A8C5RDQ7_9ANUR